MDAHKIASDDPARLSKNSAKLLSFRVYSELESYPARVLFRIGKWDSTNYIDRG
jgi:hypothetical protein